ncbi:lyase family protein [Candidatus Mycoplasma haematominutum]|uniref:Adenylosuccinate lyase n=1 Tax=Candidatus Mycoplasma haematominutum 'Birmingham 1' TaxID=1116213 RepID=G8C3L8_9MOLU|nr:lyase family protein [Candidatus Mycoplasma haematominutum]CCE66916.1 adenylosuccinate lyase [Candidatus Mycoplasma haematominutum 'Birmingham 1']
MIARYRVPQLEKLFSEESKYKRWLLLEKEVLFALSESLSIREEELLEFELQLPSISPQEVEVSESKTKHDFVAFLQVLEDKTKHLPVSRWIHYGLTSSDIIDSATSLALREANLLLLKELEELKKTLYELAYKYMDTLQVGRTHGRHAELSSFGLKFAITYQELEKAIELLYHSRRQVEVITLKGSTGTYAHISPEIQEKLAQRLKLFSVYSSTQALPRGRYFSYLFSLSLIGQLLNALAFNLRTLSREEIGEISEKLSHGQIGSSSMPHKSNPVRLENIAGLSRWLTKIAELSQLNIPLWDERDISHSSNERMSLEDAPTLLFNVVSNLNSYLKDLEINREKLLDNISLTRGAVCSQSVMLALLNSSPTLTRSDAHQKMSELVKQVRRGEYVSLEEAVKSNNLLPPEEIAKCFNLERHLSYLPKVFQHIFKKEIEEKYYKGIIFSKEEIEHATYFLAQRINWYYTGAKYWKEKDNYSRRELVEEKYDSSAVLVISLLEGATTLAGTILPLLNFPLLYRSIHFSVSGYYEQLTKNRTKEEVADAEIEEYVEREISGTPEFKTILELASKYSRVLILEDIVDSKVTLKTIYKILSKIENVKEIKSAALFVKIVDQKIDPLYTEEYYSPSLFSPNYLGSKEEYKLTEFNFKNFKDKSASKLVNWYGLIIQENVWVIGYGLDSEHKYRNFQALGELNKDFI